MEDAELPDINNQLNQIKTTIESIQESIADSDIPAREKISSN